MNVWLSPWLYEWLRMNEWNGRMNELRSSIEIALSVVMNNDFRILIFNFILWGIFLFYFKYFLKFSFSILNLLYEACFQYSFWFLFKFRLNQYGMLEVISDEEAQVILNSVRGNAPTQTQAVKQAALSQTPQSTKAPNNHQQIAASNQVCTHTSN